ncbi:MAG: extracellular solute-binding protein [candidate division NC10 bacterium]|nr:extracellular solute-binding protein [candidate division NC10 bacterium]
MRRWWWWGAGILGLVVLAAGPTGALAASADHEGQVVVYTAAQSTIVQAIGPMFEKKTGIKVQFVEGGTGEVLKRAQAEKANPLGDVFWALAAEPLAANADLLEPYTVADDAKITAIYKKGMAGGRVQPNNVTPMVIVYNKKLVSEADAPKSWKALAEPKWKDKIAYAAADKSGSSYTILATLLTVFGDNNTGWKVVEDIMKNAKILPSSSRVPKGVADGEYHAGLTYEDAAMRQVAGGAPVGVIYPQDGTSVPPDGNALIKGAKRPKAARIFLDYKGFAPLSEIKAVAYDMAWAGKNYAAFVKKWQEIIVRVK